MSDSVRPHRRQPTRLPRPWDSPGKNTGVGCQFLLQCMKLKNESEVIQSCPTCSNPIDHSPPGSSLHGIFQARVLEWGALPSPILAIDYSYQGLSLCQALQMSLHFITRQLYMVGISIVSHFLHEKINTQRDYFLCHTAILFQTKKTFNKCLILSLKCLKIIEKEDTDYHNQ